MAAHWVICLHCNQKFDASKEEYVKVGRRYAHAKCAAQKEESKSKEEKDKEELERYIKDLFHYEILPLKVKRQIEEYTKDYKYSYSGILKTLVYYYSVQHGDIKKANGGIGIVPYVYQQAHDYYYDIWLANQRNNGVDGYTPEVIEYRIKDPKPKPKRRKIFSFLDREEE